MTGEAPPRTSSRVARQGRIIELIQRREIGSQAELADLLGKDETLRRLKIGLEKLQL